MGVLFKQVTTAPGSWAAPTHDPRALEMRLHPALAVAAPGLACCVAAKEMHCCRAASCCSLLAACNQALAHHGASARTAGLLAHAQRTWAWLGFPDELPFLNIMQSWAGQAAQ